jgi:glycerophosphoryl diester phosphodiesterase
MPYFEIVAHRGVPTGAPENTIPSFQRAVDLGADAIEFDVRLTRDRVPIVHHYFYLNEATAVSGPVFDYTFDQLQDVEVLGSGGSVVSGCRIPTLHEVLETLGGRIGLEIEIKGPEPESSEIVGAILRDFRHLWETIEVTSYEPALLLDIQQRCPGLATDLLFPRSEGWMRSDVVTYLAVHRARLARARAVHLHPAQLSSEVVSAVRSWGIEVHAWDVNDEQSLNSTMELGIPRICTDKLQQALEFHQRRSRWTMTRT